MFSKPINTTYNCSDTRQSITLLKQIANSGEGSVWLTNRDGYLAKIYHLPNSERIEKLQVMVAYPPKISRHSTHVPLAWPISLLKQYNLIKGFLMPAIKDALELNEVYIPKRRKQLFQDYANWRFLHQVALNLASLVQEIHVCGYVIGDMKPQNILVNPDAEVSIIDTDSFQVNHLKTRKICRSRKIFRCLVGTEGFIPPELQGLDLAQVNQTPDHDSFKLAIILYHLLFGYHPFKGKWIGEGEPPCLDELVKKGYWPYAANSLIQPGKNTISLDILHPSVQEGFLRCFNEGLYNASLRPTPLEWVEVLETALANLRQCEKLSSHWYSYTYGRCSWCERASQIHVDIFPYEVQHNSVQYNRLRALLKAQQWFEADLETKYLMLEMSGRLNLGWLDESAIQNIPLSNLQAIDRLWQFYSQGHFGFSVQKEIFVLTGNHSGCFSREAYMRFGEQVGWRTQKTWKKYLDLNFSRQAPKGHLPFCSFGFGVCLISLIVQRLDEIHSQP